MNKLSIISLIALIAVSLAFTGCASTGSGNGNGNTTPVSNFIMTYVMPTKASVEFARSQMSKFGGLVLDSVDLAANTPSMIVKGESKELLDSYTNFIKGLVTKTVELPADAADPVKAELQKMADAGLIGFEMAVGAPEVILVGTEQNVNDAIDAIKSVLPKK